MDKCKCTMHQKMTGDGCKYCNPQMHINILEENTRASGEVIRELVEALEEIVEDAKGYTSRSGKVVSWTERGEQALAKARQHLSNTQP